MSGESATQKASAMGERDLLDAFDFLASRAHPSTRGFIFSIKKKWKSTEMVSEKQWAYFFDLLDRVDL